jgi:hypothetical protein
MNKRRNEVDGPNLHKPEGPNRPIREITDHKGATQGISSCRPGSIDHVMSGTKEIMTTRKQRWGRYALPIGFTERKYPKDLSYLTTSKNTMDRKNPNCGYQIIFKPFKYSGARAKQQCKDYSCTSPVRHGLG